MPTGKGIHPVNSFKGSTPPHFSQPKNWTNTSPELNKPKNVTTEFWANRVLGNGLELLAIHPLARSDSIPGRPKGGSIRQLLEGFVKDKLTPWMSVMGPEDEENEMASLRDRIDGEPGAMNIGHAIGILDVRQGTCKTKSIPEL